MRDTEYVVDDRLDLGKLFQYIHSLSDEEFEEFCKMEYSEEELAKMFPA